MEFKSVARSQGPRLSAAYHPAAGASQRGTRAAFSTVPRDPGAFPCIPDSRSRETHARSLPPRCPKGPGTLRSAQSAAAHPQPPTPRHCRATSPPKCPDRPPTYPPELDSGEATPLAAYAAISAPRRCPLSALLPLAASPRARGQASPCGSPACQASEDGERPSRGFIKVRGGLCPS